MSKVVKTVLIVAAAVAMVVFAPQIGAFLATAAASAGITVTAAAISSTLVSIGISMALAAASSLLLPVPKASQSRADRLNLNIDTTAPRKIVFGRTSAGQDVRFKETWGKDKDRLSLVVANASHKISAVRSVYLNNELSHNGASVTGKYASGIVELSTCLEGTPSNGRAVGSGAYWSSTSTFVGCAYSVITFRTDKAKVFPDGLPSRITTVVDGCLVYDPRRDSTRGGSGTMRVGDQSTWAFTVGGVDIGRNPALALITYLIGYRINGKLAWGWGLPPEKIDFASFIRYANLCEEPVTLKAGGTTPKYLVDGIFSTGDSHETVVNAICATMGSTVLVDTGGVFNLIGGYDDTLSVPFAFSDDDLIGTDNWNPSPTSRERFNIIKGRFADPSTLYTLADWGRIEVDPMFDNIPRTLSIDYGLIDSAEACQRISKQRLYAEKWGGIFTGVFGPRAFAVQVGDIVTLSHPRHGWNNKRFRVISQSEAHDLIFQMSLREDDSEIYAWDSQEYTPPPANLLNEEYDPALAEVVMGLSLSTLNQEGANGVTTSFVQVTWTPSTSARVSEVEINTKLATSNVWTEQGGRIENTGTYLFSAEVGGAAINVRARYVMDNGVRGPWSNSDVITSTNNLNSWNGVYGDKKPEDNATVGAPGDTVVGTSTGNLVVQRIEQAHAAIGGINTLTTSLTSSINDLVGVYGTTASAAASASSAAQHDANAQTAAQNADAARSAAEGAYQSSFTQAGQAETFRNQASTFAANASGSAATASEQANLAASARTTAENAASAANTSAGTASAKANDAGIAASAAQTSQVRASTFALDAAGRATNNIVGRSAFDERGRGSWDGQAQVLRDDGAGGFYVLQQTNRDVFEGEFIPGDWSDRRFRVSGNAAAFGAYIGRAGLQCLMPDGSHRYPLVPAGGPYAGYADFSGEIVVPQGAVAARPFLQSDGPWDASDHGVNWRSIRIEDITAERRAKDFADAASTSYSNAEIKAGEAGSYASAASGHANTASIRAGDAENSASTASGAAAVATEKASQASTSASLSASYANDASARISQVEEAAASANQAVAQRLDNLEATTGGQTSRLNTVEQVAATALDRVSGARWSKEATAGNGRAQLTVYAYDNNGNLASGVDIIGDLSVSGNVLVSGSVLTGAIQQNGITAASTMTSSGNFPISFSLSHQPRSAESLLEVTISGIADVPAGTSIRALGDLYIGNYMIAGGIRLGKNNQSNTYSLTRLAGGSSSPVTVVFDTRQDGTSQDGPGFIDCTIIIKEFKR
ncbi:hypothetical protein [Novosphingobium sp. 9U]|uniref:hypothetical protein n=1 Tax=Novosphingobium sp. 9U TaxID=2653158 RepID=UPI0012F338C2|nr:hypothetical protein [Novosphingobium sp. 9U]VWX51745.1 hypothetical protein NOVOSPHI9U_40363 [Novosphingobium sp. 9U]